MSTGLVVAIDGPSASGKSTVGRLLAERLGLPMVDTSRCPDGCRSFQPRITHVARRKIASLFTSGFHVMFGLS